MSRRQVLEAHTSRELTEWLLFDQAFGLSYAGDLRAGVIAAAVWNAAGGLPVDGGEPRAAAPGDFFPLLDRSGTAPLPRFHGDPDVLDEADTDALEELAEIDLGRAALVDDEPEETEAERVTRAMKNAWAMWGLQHNAAERAAKRIEAEGLGEPPDQPELN